MVKVLFLLLCVATVSGISIIPTQLKVGADSEMGVDNTGEAVDYDMRLEDGEAMDFDMRLEDELAESRAEPFNLASFLASRHATCHSLPLRYSPKEVVPLTIARAGSQSMTRMMRSSGQSNAFHDHDCKLQLEALGLPLPGRGLADITLNSPCPLGLISSHGYRNHG